MAILMNAQNLTGTASGAHSMFRSDVAYILITCSGNPATASLLVSPDGNSSWLSVTSWPMTAGQTSTAQVNSFLPYVAAQLDWVSAGTRTGTVTFFYDGRLGNEG